MDEYGNEDVDLRAHLVSILTGVFAFIAMALTMTRSDSYDTGLIPPVAFFQRRDGQDLFMAAVGAVCITVAVFHVVRPWFDSHQPPK